MNHDNERQRRSHGNSNNQPRSPQDRGEGWGNSGGRNSNRGNGGSIRNEERRDQQGRERSASRARGDFNRTSAAPSARRKSTDLPRSIAFDVLNQVTDSDAYANLVLPPALSRAGIRGRDAGFATELAYGTLRMQGRYDAIIAKCTDRPLAQIDANVLNLARMGAHQLLGMRVASHAAVSETVGLARQEIGAGPAQFLNAILRRVSERSLDEWLSRITEGAQSETEALSAAQSHPVWITRALRESLVANGRPAEEITDLLEADNAAPRVTLVARPGLSNRDTLAKYEDGEPGQLTPTAFILDGKDPGAIREVRSGRAGVQDEGSQFVTLIFAQAEVSGTDERWLDMCAGPGGKAALLGALAAQRDARLVANEIQPHRADLVERSMQAVPERAIERIQVWDGREIGDLEPGAYDRIMLDAPCTGLGALRRRPESRWRRQVSDLTQLTVIQKELLHSALKAVRVGGVVGYVTCSPHLAETRFVVDDVLKHLEGVEAERIDARAIAREIAGEHAEFGDDRTDIQLWPHVHGTDAMHLTLLRRLG